MSGVHDRLSELESDRIYREQIRPLHLGGVDSSASPTVVLVGGAPGSGKTMIVPQVAAVLASRSGTPVVVAEGALLAHHPGWERAARSDPHAGERFNPEADRWVERLTHDARDEQRNIVLETEFANALWLDEKRREFRAAGYRIEAVILAVEEQRTRRSVIGRYLHAQDKGYIPRLVTAAHHQTTYDGLRTTLKRAEEDRLVDKLVVIRRDGKEIYSNQVVADKWQKPHGGVAALDAERKRPLTATEKVNNAIAWHELTARAQLDRRTPDSVLQQAVLWREEASARAMEDRECAKQYAWRLAGESFRVMPREQFSVEFPAYAGAVERLNQAIEQARFQYSDEANLEEFVRLARERLATQIEQGRQFGRIKQGETPAQGSGASGGRKPKASR
jgi:hypothetical protein